MQHPLKQKTHMHTGGYIKGTSLHCMYVPANSIIIDIRLWSQEVSDEQKNWTPSISLSLSPSLSLSLSLSLSQYFILSPLLDSEMKTARIILPLLLGLAAVTGKTPYFAIRANVYLLLSNITA